MSRQNSHGVAFDGLLFLREKTIARGKMSPKQAKKQVNLARSVYSSVNMVIL
jgi:hypothetical protein